MNRIFIGLIVGVFVLSACGPSAADIQKAIEQTQAAQPTNTPIPTNTAIPPTLTPEPTATSAPEPTATEKSVELADVVLQFEDIDSVFEGLYSPAFVEVEGKGINIQGSEESYSRLYTAKDIQANIFVQMFGMKGRRDAQSASSAVRSGLAGDGDILTVPSGIKLTGAPWLIHTNDGYLVLGFYQSNLVVAMQFQIFEGVEVSDLKAVAATLGQLQQRRLSDAGITE